MKKIMMTVVMIVSAGAAYAAPDFADLGVSADEIKAAPAENVVVVPAPGRMELKISRASRQAAVTGADDELDNRWEIKGLPEGTVITLRSAIRIPARAGSVNINTGAVGGPLTKSVRCHLRVPNHDMADSIFKLPAGRQLFVSSVKVMDDEYANFSQQTIEVDDIESLDDSTSYLEIVCESLYDRKLTIGDLKKFVDVAAPAN